MKEKNLEIKFPGLKKLGAQRIEKMLQHVSDSYKGSEGLHLDEYLERCLLTHFSPREWMVAYLGTVLHLAATELHPEKAPELDPSWYMITELYMRAGKFKLIATELQSFVRKAEIHKSWHESLGEVVDDWWSAHRMAEQRESEGNQALVGPTPTSGDGDEVEASDSAPEVTGDLAAVASTPDPSGPEQHGPLVGLEVRIVDDSFMLRSADKLRPPSQKDLPACVEKDDDEVIVYATGDQGPEGNGGSFLRLLRGGPWAYKMASLSPEQLAIRRTGITASEIPAVVGLSPWAGPIDVYMSKIGKASPLEQTAAMEWGSRLEAVIRQKFIDDHGCTWSVPIGEDSTPTVRHPVDRFSLATPDSLFRRDGSERWKLLEIKTSGEQHPWDEVPDHYLAQVDWQWHVMSGIDPDGLVIDPEEAWIAALFHGREYREYRIERSLEREAALVEMGRAFWAQVQKREMDSSWFERSPDLLSALKAAYPRDTGPMIKVSELEVSAANELRRLVGLLEATWKPRLKLAKTGVERCEAKIKQMLGEAAGYLADEFKVTWKTAKDQEVVNWEAVAREAGATQELISKHTAEREGSRRFLCSMKGEK